MLSSTLFDGALQTNNPRKIEQLRALGIQVIDRVPCIVKAQPFSKDYLAVKEKRMAHDFDGSYCYWNHDGDFVSTATSSLVNAQKLPAALSSTDHESSSSNGSRFDA